MTHAYKTVLVLSLLTLATVGCDSDPIDLYGADGSLGSGGGAGGGGAGGGGAGGGGAGGTSQDASISLDAGLGLDADPSPCGNGLRCVNVGASCLTSWYVSGQLLGTSHCNCSVFLSNPPTWSCAQ
jgi:hypothetical protein